LVGKSSLAIEIAQASNRSFVDRLAPEQMVGMSEAGKLGKIGKVSCARAQNVRVSDYRYFGRCFPPRSSPSACALRWTTWSGSSIEY
jgi:hypothetical protein